MADFKSFEDGADRWRKRAERMRAVQPSTFQQIMAEVLTESKNAIASEVYASGGGGNRRTGDLMNREAVRFESPTSAVLTNTASSTWKGTTYYYGWFVAKGTQSRSKGTKYYCWMKNPTDQRPTTWQGWLDARDSGLAVVTHSVKGTRARDWRKRAIDQINSSGLIRARLRRATAQAMVD